MPISHKHTFLKYPDYISPLPADDLIKVGEVKQDMYSKGIELIQKNVDQLDQYGLTLVKEPDKKYFSQEMEKMMKAVNESSGKTDFSNIANVRNILNIGKPLENNPYIINAIQSSQELLRRQDVLTKLPYKERNAANDWEFMKEGEEWFNDGKVGTKLASGKVYTPYVSPAKHVMETVGHVKSDIRTDIIRENGFIDEIEIEELTNIKLKEWMVKSLPSDVLNQIRLDAEYAAKDVPLNGMVSYYTDTRHRQYQDMQNTLAAYEQYKDQLTPKEKEEFQKLQMQSRVLFESLGHPPATEKAAKAAWVNDHFNDFITGQSTIYSHQREKEELNVDPFSLAGYNSTLRKAETLYSQGIKYGFQKDGQTPRTLFDLANQKGKMSLEKLKAANKAKIELSNSKLSKAEEDAVANAEAILNTITRGNTIGTNFTALPTEDLNETQEAALKEALNNSLQKLGITETVSLDDVEIKINSDDTVVFRVDHGDVTEIWQDVFDPSLKAELGIQPKTEYLGSLNSTISDAEVTSPVDTPKIPAEDNDAITVDDLEEAAALPKLKEQAYYNR